MKKTYVAIPSSDSSAILNIEIFAPKDKSNLKTVEVHSRDFSRELTLHFCFIFLLLFCSFMC